MIAAPANRIKRYVEQPQDTSVQYGAVVQAALATMMRMMHSHDNQMAFNAANAILEIEKARLRHKVPLAGTEPVEHVQQPVDEPSQQDQRFEKAVDELTVEFNKIQVQKGEQEIPREIWQAECRKKLAAVGYDEFFTWHEAMMGRDAGGQLNPESPASRP
jgi:hypothetical protein